MKIDVIIPVYRPTEKLTKLLQALQRQTCRVNQIIVLHTQDGCDLRLTQKVSKSVRIIEILIPKEAFDHGGTRDIGIRKSNAEIVVMMTQDAIPANDYVIEHLVKKLKEDGKVAVAYARQETGTQSGILEQYTRGFNYPEKSRVKTKTDLPELGIKTYFCSNVCAAYNRNIYLELGGFETPVIFNEDMIFAANAINKNYKVAYVADAVVIHSHVYKNIQLLKRNFDMGVSQACYPEIFEHIKSEREGLKLVRNMFVYLWKEKKPLGILKMIIQSGFKYMGYQLGKHYSKLPRSLIMKLTMNQGYWKRRERNVGKNNT